MTVSEDQPRSRTDRLRGYVEAAGESRDVPRFVTVALGVLAAALVATSTATAVRAGYTAIALSFLVAAALFTGTVAVFEAGRRLGTET